MFDFDFDFRLESSPTLTCIKTTPLKWGKMFVLLTPHVRLVTVALGNRRLGDYNISERVSLLVDKQDDDTEDNDACDNGDTEDNAIQDVFLVLCG